MKKLITNNASLTVLGILFIFLLWFALSFSQGQGNLIFPSPDATFAKFGALLGDPFTYRCLGESLLRTLFGFGISFLLALIVGSLAGEIKCLQVFLKPLIITMKSAPTAAFVFLFLLLYGSSNAPIGIVVLLAFPILYESVVSGINAIPRFVLMATRVDGARKIDTLWKVKIPLASPYVLLGVLNSFALSFKTEIMAEIITGSTGAGIGGAIRIYRNSDPSDLTPIFALTLIAIITILLFDLLSFFLKKAIGKMA